MAGGLKIGELAKASGLTVRALHHYDEIGLLSPSGRTDGGHRVYSEDDVVRLQQIASLRQLGLSLDEIRACLDQPQYSLLKIVEMQAEKLRETLQLEARLLDRLEKIAKQLRSAEKVSTTELLQVIQEMNMYEKYYTPAQLGELEERKEKLGEKRIEEVQAEWPRLMAEVKAEMEKGTDPHTERVRDLAARWKGLIDEFTGGNAGITKSLSNVWKQESRVGGYDTGEMRKLMEYLAPVFPK